MLTPEQIQQYHRDGFVHVPGFIQDTERLRRWVDEATSWPEVPGKWMMYFEKSLADSSRLLNRMENFLPYHEGLDELAQGRLQDAVNQLFGEPSVLFKDKINFKFPGGDGFKAHQDVQANWDRWGSIHMTAMVAVDEATLENGPLEFVAGKHKQGLLGPMDVPLDDSQFGPDAYKAVPCKPGDAVFFDSFAPHRSGPNHSDKARRLLYITWNKASEGDHRARYYEEKRKAFPPDCEREAGKEYTFKV